MASLPQLYMIRRDLERLPALQLPEGYDIRTFRPGDEFAWERVIAASFDRDPGDVDFARTMRSDPAFCPERVFFVEHAADGVVGTASAWRKPQHWPEAGVIHYVGVLPKHRGRGLGRAVTLRALHRIAAEGWREATLETDDFRLPAIRAYLALGFEPLIEHPSHPERWRKVFDALGMKERGAVYGLNL